MARLDVYRPSQRALVIDVQADLHFAIRTRVVIPLLPTGLSASLRDRNPVLMIEGQSYVLASELLFSIAFRRLGPPIANLAQYRDEIVRALDVLFIGF